MNISELARWTISARFLCSSDTSLLTKSESYPVDWLVSTSHSIVSISSFVATMWAFSPSLKLYK